MVQHVLPEALAVPLVGQVVCDLMQCRLLLVHGMEGPF